MMVPLVDLGIQTAQVADEVAIGFAKVIERSAFVLGAEVAAFEEAFASFCEVPYCVGVGNGTDALEFALRALDVRPGTEVILPANSFVATAVAVVRAGAVPVLVDVDPVSLLVQSDAVAERMGPSTGAVIPVHLYGQMAPMSPLLALADEAGVPVIEDAAQAHGATQHGRPAGSFGAATGTSFFPGKNLGAFGDGGAVLTASAEVAAKVAALRNYGSTVKYDHPAVGFNSRLDTLQAVVLTAKLRRLRSWNEERRAAAVRYNDLLEGVTGVGRPSVVDGNQHVWHLYVVQVSRRDEVLKGLHAAGIQAGIHYPVPIHLQGAFRDLGYAPGDLPVTEAAAATILSLPLFPGITPDQQERVVDVLARAT